MTKRGEAQREERRKNQVEVNLLDERGGSQSPLARVRRGCSLPFLGGTLFVVIVLAGLRSGLG